MFMDKIIINKMSVLSKSLQILPKLYLTKGLNNLDGGTKDLGCPSNVEEEGSRRTDTVTSKFNTKLQQSASSSQVIQGKEQMNGAEKTDPQLGIKVLSTKT